MPGIVSGRAWLLERRRFLKEELAKDPPDDLRAALETELAAVEDQMHTSGRGRWWRWLGGRPTA